VGDLKMTGIVVAKQPAKAACISGFAYEQNAQGTIVRRQRSASGFPAWVRRCPVSENGS
jgi:hypothetical protein